MEASVEVQRWKRARSWAFRFGAWVWRHPHPLCPNCGLDLRRAKLYRQLRVCDRCGHHFSLDARRRIETLADPHSFVELEKSLATHPEEAEYAQRVRTAERETRLREAAVVGIARLHGVELMLAVLDFRFLGGTMGAATGEKIARAFEIAAQRELPLLAVTASGGARIHEGMIALMQMAKTTVAAQRLHETGRPFITILSHPTTGGVYASFANLADVILAEPRALIGFAGPRVVQVLSGQRLPSDSHRAEFLLEHGMIDAIVPRPGLRKTVANLLEITHPADRPARLPGNNPTMKSEEPRPGSPAPRVVLSAWDSVLRARHPERPTTLDYINRMFQDFVEMHGDRLYGDDPAIIAGIACLDDRGVIIIGQERGHGAEREKRNYGSSGPEGYRKAQRMMQLAVKWNLPLVTFVDTPGAAYNYEAEKRGIAMSLANSIRLMLTLPVPTIAVLIGEGGSGGALALAVADRVLMLEHAVYSVISPEGASAILYGDARHAQELSQELHLTARDLKARGVIDAIIREPEGGAHLAPAEIAGRVRAHILKALGELNGRPRQELIAARYGKYRNMGKVK